VSSPTVSVCIPTYQGAAFVERTLASVRAQTMTDLEMVIGDDGSTDGTLERVRGVQDGRIRVLPGRGPGGAAANFNRVVEAARGRYVKLLCQDDVLAPRCLERQVDALASSPASVVLAAGRRDIVDERDRVLVAARGWRGAAGVVVGADVVRACVRSGTNLVGEPSAVLWRREALERAGGFDPDRRYMVDLDLWCRLLDGGRELVYLPETLCTFRVSAASWSARLASSQAREARELFRSLRDRYPDVVSGTDLALGVGRSFVLARARRLVFAARRRLPGGAPSWT
jgi:glycosyltransferase involved in cell wall biosynthesis